MNSSQSEFRFPLYPFNYPKNTKCEYEISVNKGQMIFIDQQYYERVHGTSLKVYEKNGLDGAVIETELLRYRGFTYWSIGNKITLVFQSGNEISGKGLQVRYFATNGNILPLFKKRKICKNSYTHLLYHKISSTFQTLHIFFN